LNCGTARRGAPLTSNVRRLVLIGQASCSLLLAASLSASAQGTSYSRPAVTTAADVEAITQVTVDFRSALSRKDVPALSSLLLNENILFTSPPPPSFAKKKREQGQLGFTGAEPGGFAGFSAFVASSTVQLQEKFYNIKITQDGHLAWVNFDFEFLAGEKVENYGVESWQLLKTADEQWKIMSVVWSSHGAPR
jgi:ketosteroid isomerase-like protein